MKNKFLKMSSLILSFGMIVFNLPSVLAGGGLSKPKMSAQEQRALEISYNQIKYAPVYAEDGGLAFGLGTVLDGKKALMRLCPNIETKRTT